MNSDNNVFRCSLDVTICYRGKCSAKPKTDWQNKGLKRRVEPVKCLYRRGIGYSVNAFLTEMFLKGMNGFCGHFIEVSIHFNAIAVMRQQPLKCLNRLALSPGERNLPLVTGDWLNPVANACFPIICAMEIFLPDHVFCPVQYPNGPSTLRASMPFRAIISAQSENHAVHLNFRKVRISMVMTGIDNLDPDGPRIDVLMPPPTALARMPGPLGLRHHLHNASVLMNKVVAGNPALFSAQPVHCTLSVRHPGIVQQQNIRCCNCTLVEIDGLAQFANTLGVGNSDQIPRSLQIWSQAWLMPAKRSLAIFMNSSGIPRAIIRSGWFSFTRLR